MSEELTKEKALEICAELWDWLAEHPKADKEDWPGWKKYGEMSADCPCCEYVFEILYSDCHDCPLIELWGDDCCDYDSPFDSWRRTNDPKTRSKYAKIIADGARKELAKCR